MIVIYLEEEREVHEYEILKPVILQDVLSITYQPVGIVIRSP